MSRLRSLSDRVRNHFRRALPQRLFFLHVPKCGGTSVDNAIASLYRTLDWRRDNGVVSLDSTASIRVVTTLEGTHYPDDTTDDYPILRVREHILLYFLAQRNVRYLSGHFAFSEAAYRDHGTIFAFVTVLRDPVSRFKSSYYYNRYKSGTHIRVQLEWPEYLDSFFGQSQGYEYVKFLGGPRVDRNYTSAQAIAQAKANVERFALVGFLENLSLFTKEFERRFGVPLHIPRENPTPAPKTAYRQPLDTDLERKIAKLCEPDIEVYQHALRFWTNGSERAAS